MPITLRRSCAACAKAKHSCDLGTPRCARCIRRNKSCHYANAPLTSRLAAHGHPHGRTSPHTSTPSDTSPLAISRIEPPTAERIRSIRSNPAGMLLNLGLAGACDPFDSYPQIRLPRNVVQRLMTRFLSKIAFTYYPLDPDARSNPFITSWWPRALSDPALFHVSLQTASLDEELMAQKGFPNSQILMVDSISLLRHKVSDCSQAVRDETINAVVTLAAIEHGKGNAITSRAHIEGVKAMVQLRGGINVVMQANPLTARMVVWVALLVTGEPQFLAQDDTRTQHINDGLAPMPGWSALPNSNTQLLASLAAETIICLDSDLANVYQQLFTLLQPSNALTSNEMHDLTCFVIHRLLPAARTCQDTDEHSSAASDSLRYGLVIYMFLLHGHAYYSHAEILYSLTLKLHDQLERWIPLSHPMQHAPFTTWILSAGLVAAVATPEWDWFAQRAAAHQAARTLSWPDILASLQSFLWYPSNYHEEVYRMTWDHALAAEGSSLSRG